MAEDVALAGDLRATYGIALKPSWVAMCLQALRAHHPDAATWGPQRLKEQLLAQALHTDLRSAGTACLPEDLHSYHKQLLTGKYVLQIDEVVNMAAAARDRYTGQGGDKCLKLRLTDGVRDVCGVEYRNLPHLFWNCPAGCKMVVENVMCRRGMLLLQPENCAVLGGQVEALEAARQRVVACWNKAPEGRSRDQGPRDIFGEARAAAWSLPPPGAEAAGALQGEVAGNQGPAVGVGQQAQPVQMPWVMQPPAQSQQQQQAQPLVLLPPPQQGVAAPPQQQVQQRQQQAWQQQGGWQPVHVQQQQQQLGSATGLQQPQQPWQPSGSQQHPLHGQQQQLNTPLLDQWQQAAQPTHAPASHPPSTSHQQPEPSVVPPPYAAPAARMADRMSGLPLQPRENHTPPHHASHRTVNQAGSAEQCRPQASRLLQPSCPPANPPPATAAAIQGYQPRLGQGIGSAPPGAPQQTAVAAGYAVHRQPGGLGPAATPPSIAAQPAAQPTQSARLPHAHTQLRNGAVTPHSMSIAPGHTPVIDLISDDEQDPVTACHTAGGFAGSSSVQPSRPHHPPMHRQQADFGPLPDAAQQSAHLQSSDQAAQAGEPDRMLWQGAEQHVPPSGDPGRYTAAGDSRVANTAGAPPLLVDGMDQPRGYSDVGSVAMGRHTVTQASAFAAAAPVWGESVWELAPVLHISSLQQPGALAGVGADRLVLVVGVFHDVEPEEACVEDGTGVLRVRLSEEVFMDMTGGYSRSELERMSVGEPCDVELAQAAQERALQLLNDFHGLMLLQLPACGAQGGGDEADEDVDMVPETQPEEQGGDRGSEGSGLPVLLSLKRVEDVDQMQDVLDRLL